MIQGSGTGRKLSLESPVQVREEILERMRAVPGVTHAAVTSRAPVSGGGSTTTVVEGYEPESGTGAVEVDFALVSEGYFAALGLPVLAGRTFVPDDRAAAEPIIVVNQAAARRFWGGDAIGRRLRPQSAPDAWRRVVGVVGDAKVSSVLEDPTPILYLSVEQRGLFPVLTVVVRTDGDAALLLPALRGALREVGPALPLDRLTTREAHLGDALAGSRMVATLMSSFSLLALLLASLGVYATISNSVAARRGEMGVRAALGAPRSRLVAMVMAESLAPVIAGIAVGLVLVLGATWAVEGLLFGVRPTDPIAIGGALLTLVGVAACASWLPARRAAGVDPVQALRAE